MKFLYTLLTIAVFQSCTAQPVEKIPANPDENSLLWEISGKGITNPSYLFGTMHAMCKEDINITAGLKSAIKNSNEVYFEMDLDDPSNTLGAMLFMNMKGGKTLKELYSAEEYARITSFFKNELGMPLSMIERMKPSFIESLLYPKMMSCQNLTGMEEELMKTAKLEKKEIKGFETIAFQASIFDSIPYEMQAKELLKSIDSIDVYKKELDTMINAYKRQEIQGIIDMFTKSEFGAEDNRNLLLDNRNRNWVKQLKDILPGKAVFIAVGAGHLVGDKGLIALLREAGYTVKPLLNK